MSHYRGVFGFFGFALLAGVLRADTMGRLNRGRPGHATVAQNANPTTAVRSVGGELIMEDLKITLLKFGFWMVTALKWMKMSSVDGYAGMDAFGAAGDWTLPALFNGWPVG
ncbi:hypothetical protein ACLOJK_038314 [Asimina triloba]